MLLYQIGELFNSLAVGRSRKSIAALMDIRPDYANILVNGNLEQVAPSSIKVGETIIIQAGEKIPLDGIVIKGESILDTTALTGESLPRTVKIDDYVYSGCINKTGLLTVKVTKEYGESTVSKILNLVENASTKKAKTEKFITKFAKYYTPIVVILALSLACIPPIIIKDLTFVECLKRAMTFLVISCPCALVISVPLGFFGGIGGASKQGILIKGSNYLEALAKTKILVFDKTGTLTKGNFTVTKIVSNKLSEEKLLELAAYAESYSTHPIALSIVNSYKKEINKNKINDVKEISGNGIIAKVDNQTIIIGNKKLMIQQKIDFVPITSPNTITYIAVDDEYMGYLVISDEIKETTKSALKTLREKHNISKLVMLTGDNKDIAKSVSKELNLDEYYAELLPTDKVKKIEKLLSEKKKILV